MSDNDATYTRQDDAAKQLRAKLDEEGSREMARLREMLNEEGIEWNDNSDGFYCRTQQFDGDEIVFSAVCGQFAYGTIELWTRRMVAAKEDPVGLATAEEAMRLIREDCGTKVDAE